MAASLGSGLGNNGIVDFSAITRRKLFRVLRAKRFMMSQPSFHLLDDSFFSVAAWALCFIGAVITYFFGTHNGCTVAKAKIEHIFPNRSDVWYERVTAVLTVACGTFGGVVIYMPHNQLQAFAAGVTGPAAMIAVLSDKKQPSPKGKQGGNKR